MNKEYVPSCDISSLVKRWLTAQRALDIQKTGDGNTDANHLKNCLLLEKECLTRKAELMSYVVSSPGTELPSDVSVFLKDDMERFLQVRSSGQNVFAGPIVLAWALWNDDASQEIKAPSETGEQVVNLWEKIVEDSEVLKARILREMRLMGGGGSINIEILPPLDIEEIDSERGWPAGDVMTWSENDAFERSPSNQGNWLRAGMFVVRITAPDYPSFSHIESLVLEHWTDIASQSVNERVSLALTPDPYAGYLMAHHLRAELLSKEVQFVIAQPGISQAITTVGVIYNDKNIPIHVNFTTKFMDERGKSHEVAGHSAISGADGLSRVISPWLNIIASNHVIKIEKVEELFGGGNKEQDDWISQSVPPTGVYH